MNDLKGTIMEALADSRIDHDDLDLLSDKIEAAILSSFTVARRQACDLAARLDNLQQAVLDGQEDPDHLCRELRVLGEQTAEVVGDSLARGVSFEEMEQLMRLDRKLAYLQGLLHRLSYERRLQQLQDALRAEAPGAAWSIYMEITQLMDRERTRLLADMRAARPLA